MALDSDAAVPTISSEVNASVTQGGSTAELETETTPIIPYYEGQSLLRRVDGNAPPDEVTVEPISDNNVATPLDGFRPSNPCRFCFTPTALLGFALRSFPPSQGIRAFPPKSTHGPFHLGVFPPPKR